MSAQTGSRDGAATDLERVDLAQWQADASRWRGRRPVVLAGAFADTVAVASWTPESLAERFPDTEVNATCAAPEGWSDDSQIEFEPMPMVRFVQVLREGRPGWMMKESLWRAVGLYDELDILRAEAPPFFAVNLWISNQTRTQLHFDRSHNLFVQVHGTKRFIIEPPTSPASHYMFEGAVAHFSRVDPVAPDPVRFPDYDPGLQEVALLGAGDALYLPPGWFHHVTALDTSISANCWYGSGDRDH